MPGPKSNPRRIVTGPRGPVEVPDSKTRIDHVSGKWARRLVNRHADPIRENGGKQFK